MHLSLEGSPLLKGFPAMSWTPWGVLSNNWQNIGSFKAFACAVGSESIRSYAQPIALRGQTSQYRRPNRQRRKGVSNESTALPGCFKLHWDCRDLGQHVPVPSQHTGPCYTDTRAWSGHQQMLRTAVTPTFSKLPCLLNRETSPLASHTGGTQTARH